VPVAFPVETGAAGAATAAGLGEGGATTAAAALEEFAGLDPLAPIIIYIYS